MGGISDAFIDHCRGERPALAQALAPVADSPALAQVLRRFDGLKRGALTDSERDLARRILSFVRTPDDESLRLVNQILAYLDVDDNGVVDYGEMMMAVEICEMFSKTGGGTLSVRELTMLHIILEHLDEDGNGILDVKERNALRDGLWEPAEFLAELKAEVPRLADL